MNITIEGQDLLIRVPLANAPSLSKSGKSQVIDSTNGFVSFATPRGICKIGLNVITSDQAWAKQLPSEAKPQLVKAS